MLTMAMLLAPAEAIADGKLEITWLGHATFELVSPGGTRILIDPFLKDNPATPKERKMLAEYKPAAILVSHSHPDHSADAEAIARTSVAKMIGADDPIATLKIPDGLRPDVRPDHVPARRGRDQR